MKKRIVICIIIIETIVIALISFAIVNKNENTLGASTSEIRKENIVFDETNLKYFYEPKQGVELKDVPVSPAYKTKNVINSDTLNSLKDFSENKPDKTFRIITLGDSFTFGLYVNTGQAWPDLLQKRLNESQECQNYDNFEVINLGVPGYDTAYTTERFIKRGVKYHPDLVVWLHTSLTRVSELMNPLGQKYHEEINKMNNKSLDEKLTLYNKAWLRARNEIIKNLGENRILDYQRKTIERLHSNYSGKLIHVALQENMPNMENAVLQEDADKNKNTYFTNNIRDIYGMGGAFPVDMHPNKLGHQIIAEDLFNYVRSHRIITCD